MTTGQIVRHVVDALEQAGVPYMLVGSFSSNAYGIPRNTQDADFVVQLGTTSIQAVARQLGPGFRLEPQMRFETITATMCHNFEALDEGFKVEVFELSDDPHDQLRFARRVRKPLFGGEAWLPSPEDVVITKLRWSRQGNRRKDVDDARDVIAISGPKMDWSYIHHWCDIHGTRKLLDAIRATIPDI